MIRFALRSLIVRRGRSGLTALAVLLGVSMVAGTFIFTDTINAAFRQLFTNASAGADVVVTSRQDIASPLTAPASVPVSLVNRIRGLPGVRAAYGQIVDTATIVRRNGTAIERRGLPTLALSYMPAPFGRMTFSQGARPRGAHEVAIDPSTATAQHLRVGDMVPIVTSQPVQRFRISGIARLGTSSPGGTPFVIFALGAARDLYDKDGTVDTLYVAADKGVSPTAIVREINPMLKSELVARTRHGQIDNDVAGIGSRLTILTDGLLAFALIAVFVGAFVIFNTFSITVAQRSGEFALLRALGASRLQVLGAVLIEAAGIGVVASALGVFAGLEAAAVMRLLIEGIGFDLPSTTLTITPRTVIVSMLVGIVATVAAGLVPAIRGTRTAPLEGLRASALPEQRSVRRVPALPIVLVTLTITGLALIVSSGGAASSRLLTSGAGAILLLLAVVLVTPRLVAGATIVLAWPLARRQGVIARLARESAARNPARTAVTASSLMIGLALVLFVTVYANGLRTSSTRIVDRTLSGDFTIESADGTSPIPAPSARAAVLVPGVAGVSSLKNAVARLASGHHVTVSGVDPTTFSSVYRFDWQDGVPSTLDTLGYSDALIERDTAEREHLGVGDHVALTTETGVRTSVTIRGIYRDRALLGGLVIPRSAFDATFHQSRLQAVFVKLAPGSDAGAAGASLRQALASVPGVTVRSQQQLKHELSTRVDAIVILLYALLAMSVLLALVGLVNALSLSIYERTRELGLLRAMGMTRAQARRLIRDESIITAGLGAAIGIVLGLVFAWVMTRALASEGVTFAMPWLQVIVVAALALVAGVLASLPPALRASRLDVLAAIAHE